MCPKFMADVVDVMAHREGRAGVMISINALIVDLEDIPLRIERLGPIQMHGEMDDRLAAEEILSLTDR